MAADALATCRQVISYHGIEYVFKHVLVKERFWVPVPSQCCKKNAAMFLCVLELNQCKNDLSFAGWVFLDK